MSGLSILVLADDLTGALEVGAKFADRGLPAPVICGPDPELPCPQSETRVLVLDTETRHAAPTVAADKVRRLACHARDGKVRYVYKKTDSTLRGNIGSELQALLGAFPGGSLVYAPAYPQLGRTVVNGVLFVDGVPVSRTAFASDPLEPVRESDIRALLEESGCPVAGLVKSILEIRAGSDPGVYVLDGEKDEDLRTAARDFVGSAWLRLAAGPSGFAEGLAEFVDLPRSPRSPWPAVQHCLVVNGSMHDVSRQQMQHARETGWRSFRPQELLAGASWPAWCLIDIDAPVGMAGPELAARTGATVRDLLRHVDFDAVTVFGGDTAFGIVKALGCAPLHPLGDVLPGVPASSIRAASLGREVPGRGRDLCFITKAGGFGPVNLLALLREALESC